ncbi:TIGR03620 family F420-dependent LLM class oxidoreductase [Kutzneria sp. CA-103260]|uniref:TIGR03620 family F420-dependent LLM class oxidoreductase n=1 Tax=Kutzneria sp. CA-103260 TaxID=2802641 RepID=UPI001BA967F0|nr:TIGR03620 family F420-dependent LLM class oxidoreductase [Kutzneria sp. CA-103260]QUQ68887.1 TIGR03620 family F420-dependent LLM class oxidoreductase [Kutzneria sp. CA-103260]
MDLGSIGVWTFAFEGQPVSRLREAAAELDELGYGAIWFGEAFGREALSQASLLLHTTNRIVVATGIARASLRDPLAMAAAQLTLTEAFPERFLLGLGGHRSPKQQSVPGMNGLVAPDPQPLETMRDYLDAMDKAPLQGFDVRPRRVLAALGPQMLKLAAEKTEGAHPYFVPVEHTAKAREVLGPEPLLAVEQAVVLGDDRDVARAHVGGYLAARHQTNNLRRLGFTDADFADGGSDRLVDAITVVGDVDAIAQRVRQHLDAGANHVCIQVLTADSPRLPRAEWRELAGLIRRPAA